MMNVKKCCHSCSVSVWLDQPALHSGFMYLLALFRSPIQHSKTQFCSLLIAGDVEGQQVPVNWWVHCALLTWLFSGDHWSWSDRFLDRISLSPFIRIIIIVVVLSATLAQLSATSTSSSSTNTATGSTSTIIIT